MIAAHITDPCDLLALRLTHPGLNCLLSERFARTFPRTVYMSNNEYKDINTMILWAVEHNHRRFMNKKLLKANAWPGILQLGFFNLQFASLHAARLGNAKMMFDILDYTYIQGLDCLPKRPDYAPDQFELSRLLGKKVAASSWPDDGHCSLFLMAVEDHRLDLAESVLSPNAARRWMIFGGYVNRTAERALALYIEARVDGHVHTWCQRALFLLLRGQNLFEPVPISEGFVCYLRTAKRRECGPECDIWFGGNKRLDKVELILELRKLQRSEYRHLMWRN